MSKNDALPFSKEINREKERYLVLFWKISSSDLQLTLSDIARFKQYILSANRKDIGFVFIVDLKVSIRQLFDYILSIPNSVVTRGIIFSH